MLWRNCYVKNEKKNKKMLEFIRWWPRAIKYDVPPQNRQSGNQGRKNILSNVILFEMICNQNFNVCAPLQTKEKRTFNGDFCVTIIPVQLPIQLLGTH